MRDSVVFWGAVATCASFYFDWTSSGLQVAGEYEAARANRVALLTIVLPSFVMFLRDALRLFRRRRCRHARRR